LRRLAWAIGAIAALVALTAISVLVLRSRANGLAELADAVGDHRPVEPRLSGGFRYAPASRTRSAESATASPSADVRIAVGRLEKRASVRSSPDAMGALGVAYLVSGDAARAVPALEEAIDLARPAAGSLSDLAAAYLVRASAPHQAQDLVRALTFAERAVLADPRKAEAWFNRALALEALSLNAGAHNAWQAYLRVDSTSGWADEARDHLRMLTDATGPSSSNTRRDVDDAIRRSDRAAIDGAVLVSPQVVRDAIDDLLLVEWPRLLLDGKRDEARAVLDSLNAPASSLSGQRRDFFAAECVDAARRASRDAAKAAGLARAHQSYRTAADAYNEDRIAESARQFNDLVSELEQAGSPLMWSAKRYAAIGAYYANDYAAALAAIHAVGDDPMTGRYPRLRGQSLRLSGLIHTNRGDLSEGLTDYQQALTLFQSAGDIDSEASMYSVIGEDFTFLGDTVQAWDAWSAALKRVERTQDRRSRYVILQAASYAALREELPEAAFHLQEAALDNARQWSRPPAVLAGVLNRAEIHKRLGQSDLAVEDLNDAERYLASVHDPLLKSRNEARILLARGETIYRDRPGEAVDALTKALDYFQRTGTSWRLAGTYLARGRAYRAAQHSDLAENDFLAGIRVFERMRATISSEALRSSYFEQPWDLFTEMIGLQIERHDPARALRFAEQARARTLLDALGTKGAIDPELPSDIGNALPSGVTVVYFSALEDRLLIWTLARGRQTFAEQRVRQADLARWLARYADGTTGRDPSILSTLYDQLIRPVQDSLPDGGSIVVVPDGVLHGVPFAGLMRRETGRYLVQDHTIAIAPSLTMFLRSAALPLVPLAASARVLVVGNPRLEGLAAVTLPDAEREARDIAALYADPALLVNEAATKAAFVASAGAFDIVHFAGHAVSNDDYPGLSHLLLAGTNGRPDGRLFAHEIARMTFERTRLVVLAACRTSAGRVRRGEGVFSLARPFLAAGVPTVVASLWDVDDRATRTLFVTFHQALNRGAAAADALRTAQLAALVQRDPSWRDPFTWASFTVVGGVHAFRESNQQSLSH
jgi:CHAT domain-containing protein/tetratricopeptide (TPR) repeat protein